MSRHVVSQFPHRLHGFGIHLAQGHRTRAMDLHASRRIHPPPDFAAIHKELQSHKDLTLELLWQEYKQADAGGYGYSRFCDLYREWSRAQNFTLRQQHNPGEKLFVDYAGATIPIRDREVGEVHQAAIFVAAMGLSSYTFAEATWSQELPCWIGSHIRAFEYFGGLPKLLPRTIRGRE